MKKEVNKLNPDRMTGQEVIKFLESDGVIVHTGSLHFYRYLVDRNRFDDRWFVLKGSRTLEKELGKEQSNESGNSDDNGEKDLKSKSRYDTSLTVQERYAKEEPEWEKTYRIERAARDRDNARNFTDDGHRKREY